MPAPARTTVTRRPVRLVEPALGCVAAKVGQDLSAAPERRRLPVRRRHCARPWMVPADRSSRVVAAAATRPAGSASSRLAKGRAAAMLPTAIMAPRRSDAPSTTGAMSRAGRPTAISSPAIMPRRDASMTGATMGATTRLASGDTSDTRPKCRSTSGRVAAWAASETPSDSTSQPGKRAGRRSRSHAARGVPHANRPAVAATDSRKPTSSTTAGSTTIMPQAANPSAPAAPPRRPDSRARRQMAPITAARMTLGDAPANMVYMPMARSTMMVRSRRGSQRSSATITAPTRAMFQPLMATHRLRFGSVSASVHACQATRGLPTAL